MPPHGASRFHILGVGSIGSLLAYHLRRTLPPATHPITLFLRPTTASDLPPRPHIRLSQHGTSSVAGPFDREAWQPDPYLALAGGAGGTTGFEDEPIRQLIVATKAGGATRALGSLRDRLGPTSTVVLVQNGGLGVLDELLRSVFVDPQKRPHFVLATTTHGAFTHRPLDVVHASQGTLDLGIVPSPLLRSLAPDDSPTPFHELFRRPLLLPSSPHPPPQPHPPSALPPPPTDLLSSHLPPETASLHLTVQALLSLRGLSPQLHSMGALQPKLLTKLVVNCAINPLTALMGCQNGALYTQPAAHDLIRKVCTEASNVLAAAHPDQPRLYSTALQRSVLKVARATADNYSSMLQDVRAGKHTEIEYLNGYIARLGAAHGVPTPVNAMLRDLVKMRATLPGGEADARRWGRMEYRERQERSAERWRERGERLRAVWGDRRSGDR